MKLDTLLEALVKIGNIYGMTLIVREPNYQKQLFIIPPNTKIPLHKHDNVRTQIIFLEGEMVFERSGRLLELFSPADSGRAFIIEPDEEHGAITKGQAGIFISEQYWLGGKPLSSLHLNWNGEPLNEEHARQLAA